MRTSTGAGRGGAGLTQKEVALVIGMSERGVRAVERRALDKLRRHPALREIWGESIGEGADGSPPALEMEKLSVIKTLRGIADYMTEALSAAPQPSADGLPFNSKRPADGRLRLAGLE